MPAGPGRAPRLRAALNTLGAALAKVGLLEEAIAALRQAISLSPAYANAHHNLGNVLDQAGRAQEAKQAYRAALTINPTLEEARYNLAALGDMPPPPSTPYPYLLRLFDSYAPSFDHHLVETLNYVVPEKLHEAVLAARPQAAALEVIDLGCGTGLVGQHFRGIAGRLTGIDVSVRMIQWAERRKIYDQLVLGDYIHYLAHARSRATWCWQPTFSSMPETWLRSFTLLPGCCVPLVCSPFPWKLPRTPITPCSRIDVTPILSGISIDWPEKPISTTWWSILSS